MDRLCQKITLSQDQINIWERGPLRLQIKRHGSDWLWLPEWTLDKSVSAANTPSQIEISLKHFLHLNPVQTEDTEWSRWAFQTPIEEFYIQPFLPDKSIVIKPRFSLTLPPDEKVNFFVNIPLFFQIHLINTAKAIDVGLEKIPSVFLNKIWFGDFAEGELCYGLMARAVRSLEEINPAPHRAICQIDVHNETKNPIILEKICMNTTHMAIFEGLAGPCTNIVQMQIKDHVPNDIMYLDHAPQQFHPCKLLTQPLKTSSSFLHTGGAVGNWITKSFF